MATNGVNQDTDLGVSAHKAMEEQVLSMQSRINDLTNAVSAVEAGWSGSGHGAFTNAAEAWKAEAGKLHGDLSDISQAMGSSVQTLDQADDEVTSNFTNLV